MTVGYLFRLFGETAMKENEVKIKLMVICDVVNDTNDQIAKWSEEGAKEIGATVKIVKVAEAITEDTDSISTATIEDFEWADAIIFILSTYLDNVQCFLTMTDGLVSGGQFSNKVVNIMSLAQSENAIQDTASLSLYEKLSTGGTIVIASTHKRNAISKAAIKDEAKRTVKITKALMHM